MRLTRRAFLRRGLAGGAALLLPWGAAACSSGGEGRGQTGRLLWSEAPHPERFAVPLPVPPVLRPVRRDATTDYYEITQAQGRAEILPGLTTDVWGYGGISPGPTIEARRGRRVVIRQRNELPVPVSTHLHGGMTPAESDGYPTDLILPAGGGDHGGHGGHGGHGVTTHDGEKAYAYPNEQRAATLWYHDHRMDFTGPQVYRGLAGLYILRDDEEDALPLPAGEKELPLVICDRAFGADGAFLYPSRDPSLRGVSGVTDRYMDGVLGDVILVNGAPWPSLEVANTRYRFRVLNASNARRYELALDPEPAAGAPFVQVGSDHGLLGAPVSHRAIPIAPAERFDVVIDFSRYPVGTDVTLRNRIGENRMEDVMLFRVVRAERDESGVPARLSDAAAIDALSEADARTTRRFRFSRAGEDGKVVWGINGEVFDPARVDARVERGSTELWELITDAHHPVHVHLAHLKVLSRSGQAPLSTDAGWKDTVDLPPGQLARVLVRFGEYRGKYVFHCHNLEHEDMMMMANVEIV